MTVNLSRRLYADLCSDGRICAEVPLWMGQLSLIVYCCPHSIWLQRRVVRITRHCAGACSSINTGVFQAASFHYCVITRRVSFPLQRGVTVRVFFSVGDGCMCISPAVWAFYRGGSLRQETGLDRHRSVCITGWRCLLAARQ